MPDWVTDELALLRTIWPELQFIEDGNWVLRPGYTIPEGWDRQKADIAIRIPAQLPGEQPYAFWVRGGLALSNGGQVGAYACPSEAVPFAPAEPWGKFSWAPEVWAPGAKPGEGTGMIHFAISIRQRLEDAT